MRLAKKIGAHLQEISKMEIIEAEAKNSEFHQFNLYKTQDKLNSLKNVDEIQQEVLCENFDNEEYPLEIKYDPTEIYQAKRQAEKAAVIERINERRNNRKLKSARKRILSEPLLG